MLVWLDFYYAIYLCMIAYKVTHIRIKLWNSYYLSWNIIWRQGEHTINKVSGYVNRNDTLQNLDTLEKTHILQWNA